MILKFGSSQLTTNRSTSVFLNNVTAVY